MKKSFLLILICILLIFANTQVDSILLRIALAAGGVLLIVDIVRTLRGDDRGE